MYFTCLYCITKQLIIYLHQCSGITLEKMQESAGHCLCPVSRKCKKRSSFPLLVRLSRPLTLPHSLSLFINLFFHFREFNIGLAISDHNQTLLSGSRYSSLPEILVSHLPTGFDPWAKQSPDLHQWGHTYHFWSCCWSFPALTSQQERPDRFCWWLAGHLLTGLLTTGERGFAYFSSCSWRPPISCSSGWCRWRCSNCLWRTLISMNMPKRTFFCQSIQQD